MNGIAPAAQLHAGKCCCGSGEKLVPARLPTAGAMNMPGRASMIWVPGGSFTMGSNDFYREERPTHQESVAGFWMDAHPVTNAEFREFVGATGYVTFSERQPDREQYPDADPALLVPGSSVFTKPAGPVSLRDYRLWWAYVPGASWRNPEGPASTIDGRDDYPVVQITHEDASAYAAWAGKQLPTESEWEFAARGGLDGATYAWGEEFSPAGRAMANTWQGRFPWENLNEDGYEGRSPVHAFPPNGYGLYDMIGNVWEWTASYFAPSNSEGVKKSCCMPAEGGAGTGRRVIKGGSHLCAPNYCQRYRPAARLGEPADTATNHIGFRCVVREAEGRAV
jgi:formylglycine-generating enzyme required for sulfatase activity